MSELRDYQQRVISEIYATWQLGKRAVLLAMPSFEIAIQLQSVNMIMYLAILLGLILKIHFKNFIQFRELLFSC